tara:strand:- start:381 stop:662 length:282 start_codon:yes stop_codon:yes gene_type:complete
MFKPVNRYIQVKINKPEQDLDEYDIVLPDDYNPKQERFVVVTVVSCAADVRFHCELKEGTKILVDQSMIEEIKVNNGQITVVLDNYVVGLFED